MTKTILALIHTGNLSDNELVVASSKTSIAWRNKYWQKYGTWKQSGTKEKKAYIDWVGDYETKAFQTSKDLKTLEKQFDKKGLTVYLHEITICPCDVCIDNLYGEPRITKMTDKCGGIKKWQKQVPLMLAVFGDKETITKVLG